jgi:hypothetical protein
MTTGEVRTVEIKSKSAMAKRKKPVSFDGMTCPIEGEGELHTREDDAIDHDEEGVEVSR